MPNAITVYKERTNVVRVSIGVDVSSDTITSEIRSSAGELIATWVVSFITDGTDGELRLELDNSAPVASRPSQADQEVGG